jgi:hypothetical protein
VFSCAKHLAVFRIREMPGTVGAMCLHVLIVALAAALLHLAPEASAARNFPPQAKRGEITAHKYPYYTIDKKTKRLAAGGKIYNEQNMIVMPVSVAVKKLQVMYTLDTRGELSAIWLLTPAEAARYKKPKSAKKTDGA